MTIDFGFGLMSRPSKEQWATYQSDLDATLPHLVGHFKSLWISDHFFWDDTPTIEAWTALSYMAARWPQFDLGPMVLGQGYRNPAMLAKMAATLQNLSGGRFVMGIGAGWKEDEYHGYNFPFPSPKVRLEELEDTLEILKRMWTQPGKVTYQGKHYRVTDAYCEPKPIPVPPILIGTGGDKALALVARYADMWNLADASLERYTDRLNVLKAHCDSTGRDIQSLRLSWWGRLGVGKDDAEADVLSKSKHTVRENAIIGTTQQVIDQINRYADLGVDYFMFIVLGLPNPDMVYRIVEDVLPKVRR